MQFASPVLPTYASMQRGRRPRRFTPSSQTPDSQYVTKDRISRCKRRHITAQKTTFYNAFCRQSQNRARPAPRINVLAKPLKHHKSNVSGHFSRHKICPLQRETVSLHFNTCRFDTRHSGLTGFDSGLEWYVSTRSLVCWLLNLSGQKIIWRKQIRSRCLLEAQ